MVTDLGPDFADGPKESPRQMQGMRSHVHESATAGKRGIVEPAQIGMIEPAAIGGVVGRPIANAGDFSESAFPDQFRDGLKLSVKDLIVAAEKRRPILGLQGTHFPQIGNVGDQRLFAEDRLTDGEQLFQQWQMARVLRADDEAVDAGISK